MIKNVEHRRGIPLSDSSTHAHRDRHTYTRTHNTDTRTHSRISLMMYPVASCPDLLGNCIAWYPLFLHDAGYSIVRGFPKTVMVDGEADKTRASPLASPLFLRTKILKSMSQLVDAHTLGT